MKAISHEEQIRDCQASMLVDTENLDEVCRKHANQHSDIALSHARAASCAAKLKHDLKELQGDLQVSIRDYLRTEKKGDGPAGRVTDKQVEAEVAVHARFREHSLAIVEADAKTRDWDAMRESSRDRGFQIRNLVDMEIDGLLTPRSAKPSKRRMKDQGPG